MFVSYLSRDKRRLNYELDLLEEINRKQLGKLRAVVSPDATDHLGHLVDSVFPLHAPNLRDEYRAPVDVMLAQSIGDRYGHDFCQGRRAPRVSFVLCLLLGAARAPDAW